MSGNAIILGTGVNEMVCAHYLARAGMSVVMLGRQNPQLEFAHTEGWVPRQLVRELALDQHGLRLVEPDPWATSALPDGGRLVLWRDPKRCADSISKFSARDAARWPEYCERMGALAGFLASLYMTPALDLMQLGKSDLPRLAKLGLSARSLGRRGIEDLMRLLPMSAADWLDDWFESDALKGVLGAAGVMHLRQGPRSAGTAFVLLHHHVGSAPGVFRPPRSNLHQILESPPNAQVRPDAAIARIEVREGQVKGVVLENGEQIHAALVVSGLDPRRTLLDLVDPGWLDTEIVRALRNLRSRGVLATVGLALRSEPGFSNLVCAPSLDYLERAYDDAKYGRVSQQPLLEAVNTGVRANGRYGVEVQMQYVPHSLADGPWDDARRQAVGQSATDTLVRCEPGLADTVIECRVHTPSDLEAGLGWPQGQAYQAELTLDQAFWMRPVAGWSHYRTPIAGLYLCGPATHPASLAGVCGYHAARQILREHQKG